jgi:hypothetical protein
MLVQCLIKRLSLRVQCLISASTIRVGHADPSTHGLNAFSKLKWISVLDLIMKLPATRHPEGALGGEGGGRVSFSGGRLTPDRGLAF